jgi:hypothetical protein
MREGGGFFITDDAAVSGIDGEVPIHMQGSELECVPHDSIGYF